MTKHEYMALMKFPKEWAEWGMYPDEIYSQQERTYQKGNENASEHDRNGVFHWWLKKSPDTAILRKLILLSLLDPDQYMASDIRKYIAASPKMNNELHSLLERINNLS